MKWVKKGLTFAPDKNLAWMVSHASSSVLDSITDGVLRVYLAGKD